MTPTIQSFWKKANFKPNENQEQAILHVDGPLFLTAGPGSGKTAVLVWRTLNLIVFHGIKPDDIFLSTFTEKAAHQLRERLRTLLGIVTNETQVPYDLSKMSLGTVHSICQKLLIDRRFVQGGKRPKAPVLMDELDQYFHLYQRKRWNELLEVGKFTDTEAGNRAFNNFVEGKDVGSRHTAVTSAIKLFNRLSEECVDPKEIRKKIKDPEVKTFLNMYEHYLEKLTSSGAFGSVDFSLLQQKALQQLQLFDGSGKVFKHLIIDEYQDTNTVQERLFFKLAEGNRNICVVGDDDQALYRFRGATVENLVQFPERCQSYLKLKPKRIDLDINYRSRHRIVSQYNSFIEKIDWKREKGNGHYRVHDKIIKPHSSDKNTSVVLSLPAEPSLAYEEIAKLVKKLITTKKVQDPNQIAFLFPSVKNTKAQLCKAALENAGLKVYAPRAGKFLELEESKIIFGLYLLVYGRPKITEEYSYGLKEFNEWMSGCIEAANIIVKADKQLKDFIEDKRTEIDIVLDDYSKLQNYLKRKKIAEDEPFTLQHRRDFSEVAGLSARAKKSLSNFYFERIVKKRIDDGNPFKVRYIVNRTTSLDWSVLDLFYQLNGFKYFRDLYLLAEKGEDEGPVCNLGILTQYLSGFMDKYASVITASFLNDDQFLRTFFLSYVYALFRREESEHEDADDPFPKGRIPFLTIHQAKGLEFPVVVLGNPARKLFSPSKVEELIRDLVPNDENEPLEKIGLFDNMRMFYVALSRPKNLLILPHFKAKGFQLSPVFKTMFEQEDFVRIKDFDINTVPAANETESDLGKNYSFTGDYLYYQKCPRQYMIFKKFGFVPSRSQTMFFGSLVHKTIEDLHYLFIEQRK
ncbi:MAG: ATP-dependent helicase [Bacteroidota bacterium]